MPNPQIDLSRLEPFVGGLGKAILRELKEDLARGCAQPLESTAQILEAERKRIKDGILALSLTAGRSEGGNQEIDTARKAFAFRIVTLIDGGGDLVLTQAGKEFLAQLVEPDSEAQNSACACWPGRLCTRSQSCADDIRSATSESIVPDHDKDLQQRLHHADLYRWIRAVVLSENQDQIVDALEAIDAHPANVQAFDAAIEQAMAEYPFPLI